MSSSDHHAAHTRSAEELTQRAISLLQSHGERLTDARLAALRTIAHRDDFVTADQLASELPDVHRATIYRTLERFTELGVVTAEALPLGATGFHLASGSHDHGHLHGRCQRCHAVVALPANLLESAQRLALESSGFLLLPEADTLIGVCAACRAAQED